MNQLYGLESLQEQIINVLKVSDGNIMLTGPKGIGKRTLADQISLEYLGRPLASHPDYILIAPEDDKSIKTAQINVLHERLKYRPGIAKRRVVVIDDADTLTVSAQNSLLKVLEESQVFNFFIFVNHGKLLPTIHSRLLEFNADLLSNIVMKSYLVAEGVPGEDVPFYICACCGCIGRYQLIQSQKPLYELYRKLYNSITGNGTSLTAVSLFKLFNIMKEKDKDSFYDLYPKEVILSLFYFIDSLLCNYLDYKMGGHKAPLVTFKASYDLIQVMDLLELIREQIRLEKRNQYTSIDFFNFIRDLSDLSMRNS